MHPLEYFASAPDGPLDAAILSEVVSRRRQLPGKVESPENSPPKRTSAQKPRSAALDAAPLPHRDDKRNLYAGVRSSFSSD